MISELGSEIDLRKEGESRAFSVLSIDSKNLSGIHSKLRLEIAPRGREGLSVSSIMKEIKLFSSKLMKCEREGMTEAERYYARWKFLRENGIPSVSSMYINGDNTVVMGDMLSDGSKFFGKDEMDVVSLKVYPGLRKRTLTEMERRFLKIEPQLIKNEIERIQNLAWDAGIRLPDDREQYTVYVRPDGKWSVIVMDLDGLKDRGLEPRSDLEIETIKLFDMLDEHRNSLVSLSKDRMEYV